MKERSKYGQFPEEVRKQVKQDQDWACHYCGRIGCLEVHHIIPKSQASEYGLTRQETHCRHNAVGLCAGCHQYFDNLALSEGVLYPQVLMEQGIEYPLPRKFKAAVFGTPNPVQSLDTVMYADSPRSLTNRPQLPRKPDLRKP